MNTMKDKVLEHIEERHIEPKAKWLLRLRTIVLWLSIGFSVFFGALAVSFMLFFARNSDLDVINLMPDRASFVISSIPYLWIVATAAALLAAHYQFRRTKESYRYRFSIVVAVIVFSTIVLGMAFHRAGVAYALEEQFEQLHGYGHFLNPRMASWSQVERGRLAGEVFEVSSPRTFVLTDFRGEQWRVTVSDRLRPPDPLLRPRVRVRMIGTVTGDDSFTADRILPWFVDEGDRLMMQRMREMP